MVDPDPLTRLRLEIESIDRSIVLLLAARMDAAQRALRLRYAHQGRLTDREQESRVLERSRSWATELGLPRELVQALFQALMQEGKVRFHQTETPVASPVVTLLLAAPKKGTGRGSTVEPIPVPHSARR